MKDISVFPSGGIWCKGNLHTHTKNSDGKLSPEEVVEKFKELGHDFISLTDHRRYIYNKHLQSDDFIIIPGFEVDINPIGRNICHHIVAVRSKVSDKNYVDGYEFIRPECTGLDTVQKVIDDLIAHDNFAFYCHPVWSHVELDDFIGLERLIGMEIFNTGCHLENNTGLSTIYTDSALRRGKMRHIFATDDCHHNQNDRGKGYIVVKVVKADEKSEESIVDAIIKGRFYSSRGPEIYDFGIKNNEVYIKCSDVREIHFVAFEPLGYSFVGEKGEIRNSASFAVNENWTYVRAEIIDDNGYHAWTNPIYIKENSN